MREKRLYYIITFSQTTQAMAMEKKCIEKNIPGRIIPLPVKISAGCGLAWRINEYDFKANEKIIADIGIEYENITTLMM